MTITAVEKKNNFEVTFRYDKAIYMAIHEIPKAYWLPDKRIWIVPKRQKEALKRIMARFNREDYDGNMVIGAQQMDAALTEYYQVDKTLPKLEVIPKLKKELREYQADGAAYAIVKKCCLMGDQQGLGKTITAIAAIEAQNAFPCLVICKSSLTTNWEKEINAWSYKRPMRFIDSVKRSWPQFFSTGFCHWGICSYDSLRKFFVESIDDYKALKEDFHTDHIHLVPAMAAFKSVIIDESHLIKDESTIRTKVTVKICKGRANRYLLSGTPVLNDPVELFPQLVAMGKAHLFGSRADFHTLYGKTNKNQGKALTFLNHLLHKHCYFRRTKAEVAKEIPPKTRRVILCEIDNREEYDQAEKNFAKFLEERMAMTEGQIDKALRAEALVQITYLKFLAAKGKMKALQEWIDDLEDEGEKAVIFVFNKEIQQMVYDYKREGTVRLCGTGTPEVLGKRKESFQTLDSVKRCICSISADAEGHTLTAASNLAMYQLPWHFGKAEQCEDRIHRIGTIYPVSIDYFLGERTIDRKIYDLIMEKKDIHDAITGTDEDVENQVVDRLISIFNQKDTK